MANIYAISIFASLLLQVLAEETATLKTQPATDRFVKILEGLGLDFQQDSSLIEAPSFLSSLFKQDENDEGGGGLFEKIAQPLQGGTLNDIIVPVLPFLKHVLTFVVVPMGLEALSLITLVPVMTRAIPGVIDYFFSKPQPTIQYKPIHHFRPARPYHHFAASNIRPSTVYPPSHISNIERPYKHRDWNQYNQVPPNPEQSHKTIHDYERDKLQKIYRQNNNNINLYAHKEPNRIRNKVVYKYEDEFKLLNQSTKPLRINQPNKLSRPGSAYRNTELKTKIFPNSPTKYFNKDSKDGYFHVPVEFDNWQALTATAKNHSNVKPSKDIKDRLKTIADMSYKKVANRFKVQGDDGIGPFVLESSSTDDNTLPNNGNYKRNNSKRKGVAFEATTDLYSKFYGLDEEAEKKYGSSGISYTEYEIGPLELAFKMNKS
ncbi:uncharacterized protein LOC101739399 isoform X1 [Bombyx mori]|uniref:Uncharacterized protein n=1 Tax=Bombyx mori TaxID=7091 RepID=A0A8R2M7X5_BOMMO|nr:uncharacterized protein LOC101739399 [Bombyx mori]XP_037876615.1 uncharacterized protein LOC101739399 [Bombyx mori]